MKIYSLEYCGNDYYDSFETIEYFLYKEKAEEKLQEFLIIRDKHRENHKIYETWSGEIGYKILQENGKKLDTDPTKLVYDITGEYRIFDYEVNEEK